MAKKKLTKKTIEPFYHVTAVENIEPILAEGLKGSTTPRNRGDTFDTLSICVLDAEDEKLTDMIATRQIWPVQDIEKYAVIKIDAAGVTGRVVEDSVAESTAPWQWVIEQKCIEPKYLKHLKTRVLNFPGKKAFLLLQNVTSKKKWTLEEWKIAEKHIPPEFQVLRRVTEAQLDNRKLTVEEWKHVRRHMHPDEIERQEAFEARLDRKGVNKKRARKKRARKKAKRKR